MVARAQKPSPFPSKNRKYSKSAAPPSSNAPGHTGTASANFPGTATPKPEKPAGKPQNSQPIAKTPVPSPESVTVDGPGEEGRASYFSDDVTGRRGASGETLDADQLLAAHPKLPMGTMIRVTNLSNNRSVVVRIIDRISPKLIVLVSRRAAEELDMIRPGSAQVLVEVVSKQ